MSQETKLTPQQHAALVALFGRAFSIAIETQAWNRTCLNCQWFNEQTEICAKFAKRPPARVIVTGCPQYEPNPF